MRNCNKCSDNLVVGENWTKHREKKLDYNCSLCIKKYNKEYKKKNKEKINIVKKRHYEDNKEEILLKNKKYRVANREKVLAGKRKYYKDNQKEISVKERKYRENNKEKIALISKKWRENNRGIKNASEARRNAKKLQATPEWSELDKIKIVYEKAQWLGTVTGLKYHVDHIIPLQGENVCGLHVWQNLQILEESLNCSKNNKMEVYFEV